MQDSINNLILDSYLSKTSNIRMDRYRWSSSFRVRRIPTSDLVRVVFDAETKKQHKMILTELCNRFINPFMNLLLAMLCATILLRSSLLRRRASFAPIASVAAMAGVMALYMAATNMIASLTDFVILVVAVAIVLGGVFIALVRK